MANAQSSGQTQTSNVPDGISIASSFRSDPNTTPQDPRQNTNKTPAIYLVPNKTPAIDLAPNPVKPGIVTGTVLDRAGSVASGAVVHLSSEGNAFSRQALTGYNGEFSFANVPPGPFKLSVAAQGFDKREFSGEIASGQTVLMPPMVITIATVVTSVKVNANPVEVATEQVKEQEQQRVLRFIPNFYVTYRPDAVPLTTKLKFRLAWKSSTDPVTILGTAFLAGLQQAGDQYGEFGQGLEGYGKRLGAGYADVVASTFLSGAIFPSLLKQDPRYFYKGVGSTGSRLVYAIANPVRCKGDNGRWQVNYSNIAGAFAGAALSTTFYPTPNPGMHTLSNGFVRLGESSLAGVIQEFVLKKLTKTKPHDSPRN